MGFRRLRACVNTRIKQAMDELKPTDIRDEEDR